MSYEIGTHVQLNPDGSFARAGQFQETFETRKADRYDFTFEKVGQTLRAIKHIPIVFAS